MESNEPDSTDSEAEEEERAVNRVPWGEEVFAGSIPWSPQAEDAAQEVACYQRSAQIRPLGVNRLDEMPGYQRDRERWRARSRSRSQTPARDDTTSSDWGERESTPPRERTPSPDNRRMQEGDCSIM